MAKIDRSILQANDQNMGDFGDPNKIEASISHLADKIDGNDTETQSLKSDNTSNKSRIAALESDNTSNKSRITQNENDIASNEARLVDLLRGNQQASEVVDARMGYPVLRDKMGSMDAKVESKAEKAEVRLKAVKIELADMSEETLGAMSGNATFNLTSIPQDASVTTKKTTFATVGKNLFDKSIRSLDVYVYHVNGTATTNTAYDSSDWIPILAGQTYIINKARNFSIFNVNKAFVTGTDGTGASMTLTPAQDGYLRFTMYKADVDFVQVEKGNTATAYEPFGTSITNLSIPDGYFSANKLKDIARLDAYPFQALANFSNNTTAEKEIRNAVKMIEIFGADLTKKYCLGIIQRNYSTYGTGAYIYECDATGATTKIVAMTSKTSYAIPTGIDVFTLAAYQNSGISAKLYVDWSQITDNKQYVNTHYDKSGLDFRTYSLSSTTDGVKIKLPPIISALVGKEINVYFDNVILASNLNDYQIDVACDIGKQQNERWTATPAAAGTYSLSISVYKDGNLLISATSSIVVKAATVGNGVTKKVLFIGDSTTDAGSYTGELLNLFNADVMKVQLLGSRGTAPNLHEGRAGWRASDYVGAASVSGVTNAFYNNGFDFSYYMAQRGYTSVDVVGIHLGINDAFGYADDASLLAETTNILNRFDTMLNSIKAYNSSIKVAFLVTIPPSRNQDSFGNNYSNGQTRWRYRRNNFLFVEKLIDKYKGRESEGIYLVPINVNLDTENNMETETVQVNSRNTKTIIRQSNGVHPATIGYYQMSDVIYYWLKSFEV